jgi:hypothetical protein
VIATLPARARYHRQTASRALTSTVARLSREGTLPGALADNRVLAPLLCEPLALLLWPFDALDELGEALERLNARAASAGAAVARDRPPKTGTRAGGLSRGAPRVPLGPGPASAVDGLPRSASGRAPHGANALPATGSFRESSVPKGQAQSPAVRAGSPAAPAEGVTAWSRPQGVDSLGVVATRRLVGVARWAARSPGGGTAAVRPISSPDPVVERDTDDARSAAPTVRRAGGGAATSPPASAGDRPTLASRSPLARATTETTRSSGNGLAALVAWWEEQGAEDHSKRTGSNRKAGVLAADSPLPTALAAARDLPAADSLPASTLVFRRMLDRVLAAEARRYGIVVEDD